MWRNSVSVFKIASIFIGTVVGAGLASGKEIYQFFSVYGTKSFFGFLICFIMYVVIGKMIWDISKKRNLSSYNLLISEICPKFTGKVLNLFTSMYYLFSSSIIFAASGSIISQFFSVDKIYGTILMIGITILILKFNMNGIFALNAISVPVMICVIFSMFVMFELFSSPINISPSIFVNTVKNEIKMHNNIILSSFLYGGFNILSASGVLAPLSVENSEKNFKRGIVLGSFFLVLISLIINYLILINMPYSGNYDIPLLYVSKIFGKPLQVLILILIWVEMLSTETSSLYSLGKSISNKLNITTFKSILLVMGISIPISIFGFSKLISILYPFFGFLSFVFMYYVIKYKLKNKNG